MKPAIHSLWAVLICVSLVLSPISTTFVYSQDGGEPDPTNGQAQSQLFLPQIQQDGVSATLASESTGQSPVQIPLSPWSEQGFSAKALKTQAIELVESMAFPDPDTTPPGKELRKAFILIELRASIDGAFSSDNYLDDGTAFDHDINAAKRLRDLLADPKVDVGVKDVATAALQKIVLADRLVTTKAMEATSVFGTDLPKAGIHALERAAQELSKGDDKALKGMPVDAIRDYQKAWEYATSGIDIIWRAQDPDGDQVVEWIEQALGTDPSLADSDGDGLADGDEFTKTGTDPIKWDTDGNGVGDGDDDTDGDGISNKREVELGTNPLQADTDREGLSDGFELNSFGSDPRKMDTDADGLLDDSEYRLGTDPRNPDSDGDGVLDGFETYTSSLSDAAGNTTVALLGTGDVARGVTIQELSGNSLFQGLPGQLSAAVDIQSASVFESARIKMKFDPALVPNGDVEGLRILYYDETARTFFGLDSYGVDAANGYAWADTNHFTVFVLFYIPNWQSAWAIPIDPGRGDPGDETRYLDVMLILDSSGSMSSNDPSGYRRIAAKSFVDALIEGDRVGVIDFDSSARLYQSLTTDFAAAKLAVDRIDSSGGTNIGAGVSLAHQQLLSSGDPDHIQVEILLTDGIGSYNPSLTTQAVAAGITIYTIGLGSSVDVALLRSIAEATGGLYFPVASAEQLPDVFQRIPVVGGQDTDGDGLPDLLETNGIRIGNGSLVFTDPNLWDTDGDGLSDGEELGELLSAPWGNYYTSPSNPMSQDSDDDGLTDVEEEDIGTSPTSSDTDGDGLSDLLEVDNEFDPFNRNPDGDHRSDFDEWQKDSDPYSYDPTQWECGKYTVEGLILGDFGENFADLGWISSDSIRSFCYLGGWFASGVVVYGDIRDVLASLVRADLGDTFLNALALAPVVGDVSKAVRIVTKWLGRAADLAVPLARWLAKTFASNSTILKATLKQVGYTDELAQVISRDELVVQLARYRNDFKLLDELVKQGVRIGTRGLDGAAWARVEARLGDAQLWDLAKLVNPRALAEARAVEAAVEHLATSYDVLYVGRNLPIDLADGSSRFLSKGPDIVAVNRATGRTVVVEVKGSVSDVVLTGRRLMSRVQGNLYVQTSLDWLRTNPDRYLATMQDASEPAIRNAADRLEDVIVNNQPYESLIIGYGPDQASRFGKVDDVLRVLNNSAEDVEMILIQPR